MIKIYYFLARLLSPLAVIGFSLHQTIVRQSRSRVIILNEQHEVLLVKNALHPQKWTLPGGGVNKDESPESAARREIFEELKIELIDEQVREHVTYVDQPRISYKAIVYVTTIAKNSYHDDRRQKREIAETAWWPLGDLPNELSEVARRALNELPKIS